GNSSTSSNATPSTDFNSFAPDEAYSAPRETVRLAASASALATSAVSSFWLGKNGPSMTGTVTDDPPRPSRRSRMLMAPDPNSFPPPKRRDWRSAADRYPSG